MTVEDEQFPVGMHVLAVDDDPTCLLLLETLLRRCQYNVTTTTKATKALEMLRENKNKFELVISDVHMPDMDGFRLLELVGLMMDLPVIMLSGNGDPKLVMKGITHGACDYLLKPVRIEELKNIWQHVIRRKKFDNKDRSSNLDNQVKSRHGSCEVTADQKVNKKRKDQNEDDDEDCDENGNENEDPTTQKKPRVVWSVELHRKFVAAVNQLGIDKAVPKKILDLMNVEKLTRENVASHLQKYRLYLKRISCVANQHANMVAALSGTDSPYLPVGPMNGLRSHNLTGSAQFHNTAFGSLPPSGMLGRLNSPASLSLLGLSSTGAYQLDRVQTPSHLTDGQSHFRPVLNCDNKGKILHGMPMPLEFDQMHSSKVPSCNRDLSTDIVDTVSFSASNSLADAKMIIGGSNNSFLGVCNNPSMLEGHHLVPLENHKHGKQSSVAVSSLDTGFSAHFVDQGRLSDLSSAVQSTGVQSTSLSDRFEQATLSPNNLRNGMSTMALQSGSRPFDGSSIIPTLPIHLQNCKPEFECHGTSINNGRQIISSSLPGWDDHRGDAIYYSNDVFNSLNTSVHGVESPIGQSSDMQNAAFQSTVTFNLAGKSHFMDPLMMKQNEIFDSTTETLRTKEGHKVDQPKHLESYGLSNFRSLDDLAGGAVKQESEVVKLTEDDFGYGAYSLRKCMEKYS